MREAVYRLAAPLLARIPDISGQPVRKRAAIGLVASIAFHLLIFLVLLLFAAVFPEHVDIPPASRNKLEIQLMPAPSKEMSLAPPQAMKMQVIDPRGMEASKEKPKTPEFESEQDMVAGSQAPPSGFLPLPSQEGRTDRNANDFATQDVRLAVTEPPAPAPPPPPMAAQPNASTEASAPSMPPLYDPNPVAKEKLQEAEHAKPDEALPEPAKQHSPPPLKVTVSPKEDEVAVAKPTEDTKPDAITKVQPAEQPVTKPKFTTAMMATPKPFPAPNSPQRFQEDLKKTRVEGSISNRGAPGVDAVATPLGRYYGQVKRALASAWTRRVQAQMSLISPGSASFSFYIASTGRVSELRMEANSSNPAFANLCEQAVREAPIPPPPADLVPTLRDGGLDYQMTFTFYDY